MMIMGKALLTAGLTATSTAFAGGAFARERKLALAEKHELRQDRREFRRDAKDARKN